MRRDRWFGMVAWAFSVFITAMVLHEERGDETGVLRAEIECRLQPDCRDLTKLLAQLRRDR